jgi:hypothetical protein
MDLAETTFHVSSTATVAAPAPAGPHSGGSKSVLDGEESLLFTLWFPSPPLGKL